MIFGTLSDLRARLRASISSNNDQRPICLLAGSGLTVGAVPGVDGITNAALHALDGEDAFDLVEVLGRAETPAARYQAAFSFLALRRSPDFRDRVIRAAVLSAYKNKSTETRADIASERLAAFEADNAGWRLPPGVESLGRFWVGLPQHLRGPIITTNFDPLCEIAINRAGATAIPKIIDADGSFLRDLQAVNAPQVVHVNGYWRDSATLSMTAQLDMPRPALEGALKAVLSKYTLWVIAYGGWEDAFTRQLVRTIREQAATELDVLWCYYGSSTALTAEAGQGTIIGDLMNAPGNVQFYVDFDVNEALPRLEKSLSSFLEYPDSARSAATRGPVLGWIPINSFSSQTNSPDDVDSALSFFDGRLPNWSDATSQLIPRRDIAETLRRETVHNLGRSISSLTVLTAASDEGKTTAAMQVAAAIAAEQPDVDVYFNSDGRWTVETVLSLPADRAHLLVIDDGFRSIERLRDVVQRLNESGRRRMHLLVVSRDTDWSSVGGNSFAWSKYVTVKRHHLKGVTFLDAKAIVTAWERIGKPALGDLSQLPTSEARIAALMDAAVDVHRRHQDGALLGALLKTKYGAGLVDHVRELLLRLGELQIYAPANSREFTLLEAFFMIALPHAAGVRTLPASLLGASFGLSDAEVLAQIIIPLGDEAAISFNGDGITTRHSYIAEAACDVAGDLGVDLTDVTRRIVVGAVRAVTARGMQRDLHPLAYLSQHLGDKALSVAAARAAVDTEPRRISYRSSLSRALRRAGEFQEARNVSRDTLADLTSFEDLDTGARPYFNEWGVTEGNLRNWGRNTVLCAVGLQDLDLLGPITARQAAPGLACLALALHHLWERERSYIVLQGLAAIEGLSVAQQLEERQQRWIIEASDVAFHNGAPRVADSHVAARLLGDACRATLSMLEEPLERGMPPLRFRFDGLRRAR